MPQRRGGRVAQSLTAHEALHSPAVGVWVDLEAAGVELRLSVDGGLLVGPPGRVTPAHVEIVRAHKDALRLLVRLYDHGVEQRRAAFPVWYQLWAAPPGPVAPVGAPVS